METIVESVCSALSPASVVATRVAEIDFAVWDDRVVPFGNVDRSVRSHLHVDRAEGDVVGLDQLDLRAS